LFRINSMSIKCRSGGTNLMAQIEEAAQASSSSDQPAQRKRKRGGNADA